MSVLSPLRHSVPSTAQQVENVLRTDKVEGADNHKGLALVLPKQGVQFSGPASVATQEQRFADFGVALEASGQQSLELVNVASPPCQVDLKQGVPAVPHLFEAPPQEGIPIPVPSHEQVQLLFGGLERERRLAVLFRPAVEMLVDPEPGIEAQPGELKGLQGEHTHPRTHAVKRLHRPAEQRRSPLQGRIGRLRNRLLEGPIQGEHPEQRDFGEKTETTHVVEIGFKHETPGISVDLLDFKGNGIGRPRHHVDGAQNPVRPAFLFDEPKAVALSRPSRRHGEGERKQHKHREDDPNPREPPTARVLFRHLASFLIHSDSAAQLNHGVKRDDPVALASFLAAPPPIAGVHEASNKMRAPGHASIAIETRPRIQYSARFPVPKASRRRAPIASKDRGRNAGEPMDMTDRQRLAREGFHRGLLKGWSGFLWMMRILFPVSFLTALLQWSGFLRQIEFAVSPAMGWMGLPPAAALPIIMGLLTNIYGGIAAMIVLPLTAPQMTLVAIFLLIAHNMIQEGVIQANSGIHPLKATAFRLVAAMATTAICARFLSPEPVFSGETVAAAHVAQSFQDMVAAWLNASVRLAAKIFVIIMLILTLLETLKTLEWIQPIVQLFSPVLWVLGVSRRVGMLWLTAVVFGLGYGGAVIVEEAKQGSLSAEDLEILHLSIGINHSMIEDPLLFMALGLSAFWLYVPRLIMAILAVHALRLWHRYRPA